MTRWFSITVTEIGRGPLGPVNRSVRSSNIGHAIKQEVEAYVNRRRRAGRRIQAGNKFQVNVLVGKAGDRHSSPSY